MQEATLTPTLHVGAVRELGSARPARRGAGSASRSSTPARTRTSRSLPGTARRAALDDALAEIDAGRAAPSSRWKVRYGLMLGLERVLAAESPATAAGNRAAPPPDRRARGHADRADRGHAARRRRERQRRPNGQRRRARRGAGRRGGRGPRRRLVDEEPDDDARSPATIPAPRGATASATRPRPARRSPRPASSSRPGELGVLILTHRRLLVDQFRRDLTTEGYGDRLTDAIEEGSEPLARRPDHDPDLRLVRPPRPRALARRRTSS